MSVWPFGHWCWWLCRSPYIIYIFFSSSKIIFSSVAFADVAVAIALNFAKHTNRTSYNISFGILFFCQYSVLLVFLSFFFLSFHFASSLEVNEKIALLLRIKHNKVVDSVICYERYKKKLYNYFRSQSIFSERCQANIQWFLSIYLVPN